MQNADWKSARQAGIDRMQAALKTVEPVNSPRWLLAFLLVPLFFWESGILTVRFLSLLVFGMAKKTLEVAVIPFLGLIFWLDCLLIMRWYFARILDKMTGGNP